MQKNTRNKYWWGCGEKGALGTISWNVNWCSHYRKYLVWRLCKKLKIELLYNPAIPLLDIFWKEMKSVSPRTICIPIFITVLFTVAKIWKQPNCCFSLSPFTFYLFIYFQPKKLKSAICDNMDKLDIILSEILISEMKYYTKWNASNKERQMLYNLSYRWNLKSLNS